MQIPLLEFAEVLKREVYDDILSKADFMLYRII